MLFNSIDFAIFLPIVFFIYWFLVQKNLKIQNLFVFIASYVFYGWWDWRFLGLIFLSTLVDYTIGILLDRTSDKQLRKGLLSISLIVNLGMLGFFKYYNFFLDSLVDAFTFFGQPISPERLDIVLPVGISFYTFQTLSYTIDVYRKNLKPTKDFVAFGAFVSFFPQLVAGPIERASHLLPQFYRNRKFNYNLATDGVRQMLWGFFKKIVIADNCAPIVNDIFNNYQHESASTLVLGAVLFAFQIYGDFSGYSDIAIGVSRLFGFDLKKNFAFPYFSRDMAEFWRRWHISLSTWFRDYLYIPLGGSKGGKWMQIRNTFIIFLVSGFWHGANWTFIIWGLLNALYFLPLLLGGKNRRNLDIVAENTFLPNFREILQMGVTFVLTCFAWIFFRASSVTQAIDYIYNIFDLSILSIPHGLTKELIVLLGIMILMEWLNRRKEYGLQIERYPPWGRRLIYFIIVMVILTFGNFGENEFIYFQF